MHKCTNSVYFSFPIFIMSSALPSVFILSPLIPSTGNLSTVDRMQSHFLKQNINCSLHSTAELSGSSKICNVAKLNEVAAESNSCGFLLLHAYKSGRFTLCTCGKNCKMRLRYGLVFGGTDINEDVKDTQKCDVIKKCIKGASFCVAFTEHMKRIATKLCPDAVVFVKGQALDYELYSAYFGDNCILKPGPVAQKGKPIIFVLPCNIRPVKDPMFVVKDFFRWASAINHAFDVRLLILGNFSDEKFGSEFCTCLHNLWNSKNASVLSKVGERISSMRKRHTSTTCSSQPSSDYDLGTWVNDRNGRLVMHFPSLPRDQFQHNLKNGLFFALINTSCSEGMASSVLEAMANGVPVIVRDIPSNKVLVRDRDNGLLFHTSNEFVNQADRLLKNDSLRQQLVYNAKVHVMNNHVPQKEAEFYVSLVKSTFL